MIGAAEVPPCPPCSTKTAAVISRKSLGAHPTNHALSSNFLSDSFLNCVSLLTTCAVPVFQHTSNPLTAARLPVPYSLTTPQRPRLIILTNFGLKGGDCLRGAGKDLPILGSSEASTT